LARTWLVVKKIALVVGSIAVFLALLAAVAYAFGGPWVPTREQRASYERMVKTGQAPALERRFVLPIPGCVCHSKDPGQVVQHSNWRIRECASCHGGGAPATNAPQ
jgi:hypothetical protein